MQWRVKSNITHDDRQFTAGDIVTDRDINLDAIDVLVKSDVLEPVTETPQEAPASADPLPPTPPASEPETVNQEAVASEPQPEQPQVETVEQPQPTAEQLQQDIALAESPKEPSEMSGEQPNDLQIS